MCVCVWGLDNFLGPYNIKCFFLGGLGLELVLGLKLHEGFNGFIGFIWELIVGPQ